MRRSIKAVRKAGLGIARIEINADGGFTIVPDEPGATSCVGTAVPPDDLDGELAEFKARHGQD